MKKCKKSLYEVIIELSESHCRFKNTQRKSGYADLLRFNLDTKTIKNGETYIMKNGVLVVDKITLDNGKKYNLKGIDFINPEDLVFLNILDASENTYENINILYANYKTSVPSEHAQFSRQNFKAKRADELTMEQLVSNMQRIKAQYMLETYILLASLKGWITWENDSHFFWQSSQDKELILYKSWI